VRGVRSVRLLLDPDPPVAGGTGSTSGEGTGSAPPAPAAPAAPADPPAAETVINGTKTERETKLETDLQAVTETVKQRETKIAELEDQLSQLQPKNWRPFKL